MFLVALSIKQAVVFAGWLSLAILVFFIFYRRLLKRLQRQRLEKELYLILHPIEENPAIGTVQIYFEMHSPLEVEVSIFSTDNDFTEVLEHKLFKKGGNIIELDTTRLNNGFYFYQAKTHNQKTKKLVEIRN